jgi:hypothetical protein
MPLTSTDIERIQESFRKQAGALAFKELTQPAAIDPAAVVLMQKAASADPELFKIALEFSPGDPFAMYETLGGDYKKSVQGA